jgi:hypothetical protein
MCIKWTHNEDLITIRSFCPLPLSFFLEYTCISGCTLTTHFEWHYCSVGESHSLKAVHARHSERLSEVAERTVALCKGQMERGKGGGREGSPCRSWVRSLMEDPSLLQLSPKLIADIILCLLEYDAVWFDRKAPTYRRTEGSMFLRSVLIYRMTWLEVPGHSKYHGHRQSWVNNVFISVINHKPKATNNKWK